MENKIKREYYANVQPSIRENEDGAPSRTIEGYGIVFNEMSVPIYEWGRLFREVIEPSAISQDEIAQHDVKMTMYHNREKLLARENHGKGSLTLEVDERGVKYSFEAPKTADGDTALELVRRGDIAGASFMFYSDEDASMRYERQEDDSIVRYITHIDHLFDVTLATTPAYPQTTAEAREMPISVRELLADDEGEDKEAAEREKQEKIKANETAIAEVRKAAEYKVEYQF